MEIDTIYSNLDTVITLIEKEDRFINFIAYLSSIKPRDGGGFVMQWKNEDGRLIIFFLSL